MLEDFGERLFPVECLRVNAQVVDDAVADADRVVEAGEGFAALGGFDPEAEAADLDRFVVEVDAVEVVFEDPAVEVEERTMAAELVQAVVGMLVDGVQLIEGFDEKRAATAGGVENAEGERSSCQASQKSIRAVLGPLASASRS